MFLIFEDIAKELKQHHAVNLESYRSSFLLKKIKNRMKSLSITVPEMYLAFLRNNSGEPLILIQEIGICVSLFFRNPFVYSKIEQQLLPAIIESKRHKGNREIRIWSAGCATGEEPYSIAILMHRLLKDDIKNWKVHIFATDIEPTRLTTAAEGVFSRDKMGDTRLEIIDKYFKQVEDKFILNQVILNMVNFSLDDLTSADRIAPSTSIFGSFDLILCRNVMIYFNISAKMRALGKLINALNSAGFLIIGESEGINENFKPAFIEIDDTNHIYQKK
jgi:chemotaxis protein methyltransferase CheR